MHEPDRRDVSGPQFVAERKVKSPFFKAHWKVVVLMAVLGAGYFVHSRMSAPPIVPGCAFGDIAIPPPGAVALQLPPEIRSENGAIERVLTARYAEHEIGGCKVRLRSYDGLMTAPTWRIKPGDALRIELRNEMGDGAAAAGAMPAHAMHGSVNGTNLHTHGLHVSPEGHQDNPLINVQPGSTFDYDIKVPADHAPGTFWYHPHLHGGTAVQQSSGMSGALIVEGGLDDVPEIKAAKEQILVLQQITYDQTGELEDFGAAFGPGAWRKSRRLTLINGQIAPTIVMRPGEVQRWRIIQAGTRENVALRLEGHVLNEIAADGIALGRMVGWSGALLLSPGYRTDVLVQAGADAGTTGQTFDLIDDSIPAALTLQGQQAGDTVFLALRRLVSLDRILEYFAPKPRQVLAHVVVAGEPVAMALPAASSLRGFAPYRDIRDDELTDEPQRVTFDVDFARCDASGVCVAGCFILMPGCKVAYTVSDHEFNEAHARTLKVGQAAEWTIDARIALHPFHIHVNPFQFSRLEPDGQRHLVWKDTLQVVAGDPPTKLRMRYADFKGTSVLHCHILDHEDQGMMDLIILK